MAGSMVPDADAPAGSASRAVAATARATPPRRRGREGCLVMSITTALRREGHGLCRHANNSRTPRAKPGTTSARCRCIAYVTPPQNRSGRSVAIVASLALAAGVLSGVTDAHAAGQPTARVCAHRVALVESPGGAIVGVVRRGDLVTVLRRTEDDRWRRVQTTFRTRGWLRTKALCAGDR